MSTGLKQQKKERLKDIQLQKTNIVIKGVDEKGLSSAKCALKTKNGTLLILNEDERYYSMPMDPLIFIEDVQIKQMKLNIVIRAIINT